MGSGKSTVARMLAEHGAVGIDADTVAHEVMEPGGRAYQAVVSRFGPAVLSPDGRVDRPKLAEVVFADASALGDLNSIVHPAVREVMAERTQAQSEASTGQVVVLEIPLLVESGAARPGLAGVIVVDCPVEVAIRRAVEGRGMDEESVRARIAAQVTREQRLARADFVVDNSGSLERLGAEVDRCWRWIEGLQPALS